jgi:hypothetical protein
MTTDSDQYEEKVWPRADMWKPAAALGFSKYEVSADGFGPGQQPVRRIGTGKPLAVSVGPNGYPRVKPYDDDGNQRTVEVHALVYGTYAGRCPPGMQIRHYDDNPWNNRWRPGGEAESVAAGGNLFTGDRDAQEADRYRNGRPMPAPRPVRHCFNCTAVLTTNGKRCHECVVKIGVDAAAMLRTGLEPWDVAERLGYPSIDGIVKLAVVHGGYGQPRLKRWLHSVTATVRDFFPWN